MIQVSVKDFGPIVEGTVKLKPLTIFVGPSNAGKSYMATLVYSLMQSVEAVSPVPFGGFGSYEFLDSGIMARRHTVFGLDRGFGVPEEIDTALRNWARNVELHSYRSLKLSFENLPEGAQSHTNEIVESLLESLGSFFNRELERCHGSLSDMRRRGSGNSRLRIGLVQSNPLLKLNFREGPSQVRLATNAEWDVSQAEFDIPRRIIRSIQLMASRRTKQKGRMPELRYGDLFETLLESALSTLFKDLPGSCYYLPAARSGIAQGHKAIASILVRQSSFAAIRPLEIPTLSGIITDFMGHILTMERAVGFRSRFGSKEIMSVVDFLEREVVRGEIDIERSGKVTYPEILYAPISSRSTMGKFPFHKTSSMVSELAPVILFLKYLVQPGDLVILEEPESHLHPASQREMARGIARLVNAGVKVIITTHSDYFINQVNNLLKLSRASRQKRSKEGYAAEDCLEPANVGAYHFRLDDNLGGSLVEELPIIPGFGIDEREFAKVTEELYEETISLQRIRTK